MKSAALESRRGLAVSSNAPRLRLMPTSQPHAPTTTDPSSDKPNRVPHTSCDSKSAKALINNVARARRASWVALSIDRPLPSSLFKVGPHHDIGLAQRVCLTIGNIYFFVWQFFFGFGPSHASQLLSQCKAARTVPLHSPLVKHTPQQKFPATIWSARGCSSINLFDPTVTATIALDPPPP